MSCATILMFTPIIVQTSHKITYRHSNWCIILKSNENSPITSRNPSLKHKIKKQHKIVCNFFCIKHKKNLQNKKHTIFGIWNFQKWFENPTTWDYNLNTK